MMTSKQLMLGSVAVLVVAAGVARLGNRAKASPSMLGNVTSLMPTTQPAGLRMLDLDGVAHSLEETAGTNATAFVFLSTQCPISNKYVPELNRLAHEKPASTHALRGHF